MARGMKETDKGLGCLLFVMAGFLAVFLYYHGPEIAQRLLHG